MLEGLPYPWSEQSGLSRVIDDPTLWAFAFSDADEKIFRQTIKRVAKRTFRSLGVLRVGDDAAFGTATTRLLSSQSGRMQLQNEGLDGALMSAFLIDAIGSRHSDVLPEISAIAPEDQQGLRTLRADLFRTWLVAHPPDEASEPAIAALLCAFAMRGQADARLLVAELVERSIDFRSFLSRADGPTETRLVDDDSREVLPEPGRIPETIESEDQPDISLGENPDDPKTADSRKYSETLSIVDWRREMTRLRDKLADEEQRLAALEQVSASVAAESSVVAKLPWLRNPLMLGKSARLDDGANAASEMTRLQDIQRELSRVLRAHTQAEALTQRIGRQPSWIIEGDSPSLEELANRLEALATELASEAEGISQIIENSRSFLDRLAAGDAGTAVLLCENANGELWRALARTLFDPTLNSAELRELRASLGTASIAAVLVAHFMKNDRSSAAELIRWLFPNSDGEPNIARAEVIFGFLSFGDLREIACTTASAAEAAALLIFAASLRRNRADLIEHLTTIVDSGLLDGITREFYRTLLSARHRGNLVTPAAELRQTRAVGDEAHTTKAIAEKARQKLILWLNSPPGMKRTFHRLRVYAQVQFLHPLRSAIEDRDAAAAWRLWQSFGGVEKMVSGCIANLKTTDKPEARHFEQTQAYIEDFAVELERWANLSSQPVPPANAELAHGLEVVRAEAPRNTAAAAISRVIETGESVSFPAADFAERLETDDRIRSPSTAEGSWLVPTMLASWPRALEGEAHLSHLIADSLRAGLIPDKITLAQAVDYYLAADQLEAARHASAGHPEIEAKVEEVFARRREALCAAHAGIIAEAESAADSDQLVAEYLSAMRGALADDDFTEAEVALELLGEAVIAYRQLQDPTRRALIEWLREAGYEFTSEASTAALDVQADRIRREAAGRRSHVKALIEAATHNRAAEPVQIQWNEAARRLDRPICWTDADTSALLAEAIAIIGRALRGKWQTRLSDDDPSTIVVRRIAEWVPERLDTGLCGGNAAALESAQTLADMLDEGCGDAALLRFLGAVPEGAMPALTTRVVESAKKTSSSAAADIAPAAAHTEGPRVVELPRMLHDEPPALAADYEKLRLAARAERWAEVRSLAARLAQGHPPPAVDVQRDLLAVYGVARLAETPGAPEWLVEVTVALFESRRAASYYLGKKLADEFGARALLRIAPSDVEGSLTDQLAESLTRAVEMPSTAAVYLHVGEFFRGIDAATPRVAEQLWMIFKGTPRSERPRAALLRLLFRLRQLPALRHLVEKTAVDKLRSLVRACLDAFFTGETQPEARPVALQLSAALRDQATGVANTLPWILLFHNLEGIRDESDAATVQIELDSDFAFEDAAGALWIELRIKPSLSDPPARLTVRLGDAPPFPLFEEPIYTDRIVRVPLPLSTRFSADGESKTPYTIEGTLTATDAKVFEEGVWTINRAERVEPLEIWKIEMLWPGAKRDPVLRNHGFFGREREIKEIESRLMASPRARSVMLFGERRIGKTSIIRNLITSLPPSAGRLCGVFCDVAGLQAASGDLAVRFFERVATFLINESDNAPILAALRQTQPRVTEKDLTRGLNPRASLYAALDGLARRLDELSGGTISRVALFIDEFDRFVVPMLGDRREEVNQLMWELRQVIQRSARVAIVLAGSGLQRLYKENYNDALFGSIDEVSLFRFDWDRDREPIVDTFLPQSVRSQLCRPGDAERVARRAAEICDGHPMFLALLGSAAAKLADGRQLTPGFLDRVVAAMMREKGLLGGETIERQVFYGFIFDQLEVIIPREAALAKSLFASLAQHTTPDARSSSLRISRLLEVSGLLGLAETAELLQALDHLVKIDVVVIDRAAARVRISVPLTAAAAREDAPRLRDEARERLRLPGIDK